MVKTLRFHCRGRGFNPWSGKFHVPHGVAKKKKKNSLVTPLGMGRYKKGD